jgi:hypothetical protein
MRIYFTISFFFTGLLASAQSVGVGTSTPAASAMLHINSTTKGLLTPRLTTVQRTAIGSPANGLLVYDTNTNSFWYFKNNTWTELSAGSGGSTSWSASGNNIYNNNSGVVGIGTSLPESTAKLTVETADYTNAWVVRNTSGTAIFQTYVGGAANGNTVSLGTPGEMPLALYTNNANRMFINPTGNIGIGTDNPGNKLEVVGTIGASAPAMSVTGPLGFSGGSFSVRNTNGNGHSLTLDGSGMQSTFFDGFNTVYRTTTINPFGGNVGIGTNYAPSAGKLEIRTVAESVALHAGTADFNMHIFLGGAGRSANSEGAYLGTGGAVGGGAPTPLHFFTNQQWAQASLLPNGNFGINTTNPNSKLEVNGGVSMPILTLSTAGSYTLTDDDYTIVADCLNLPANNISLRLPAPSGRKGRLYNLVGLNLNNIAGNNNYLNIYDNNGNQLSQLFYFFDGTDLAERSSITVQSNGAAWIIITDVFRQAQF